jgi:cytoskeletal protein CcmA (bactofilin family)
MALIGHTLIVRGQIEANEDLVIEGRVEGPIWTDGGSVTVAANATVAGDIVARNITVAGQVDGTVMATGRVVIQAPGRASGRVLTPAFVLDEGSWFNGTVEPQQLEAALQVARHRRRQLAETA